MDKRWWLVVLVAVAAGVAALALPVERRPQPTVTFEVWGPPSAAQVVHGRVWPIDAAPYRATVVEGVVLPWRVERPASAGRELWVRATAGVVVSCRVSQGGRVLSETSGAGEARCESGQAP